MWSFGLLLVFLVNLASTAPTPTSTCPVATTSFVPLSTFTDTETKINYYSTSTETTYVWVDARKTIKHHVQTVTYTPPYSDLPYTVTYTSTATRFGSVTVTQPTPCGFIPIKSEPIFFGPRVTTTEVLNWVSFVEGGPTSTETQTGTTTVDVGPTTVTLDNAAPYLSNATVVVEQAPAQPTRTQYAGCSRDNIILHDPQGKILGYPSRTVRDYQEIDKGITHTPEECCRLCFDTPFCYGSTLLYRNKEYQDAAVKPRCTIYVAPANLTTCNPNDIVFYVAATIYDSRPDVGPIWGIAASNGPCGRIPPDTSAPF